MGCFKTCLSSDPCFGCVKLWIAATLVAGIEIIYSAAMTVLMAVSISTVSLYRTNDAFQESGMSTFLNFWKFKKDSMEDEDLAEIKSRLYKIYVLMLIVSLLVLVVASILLFAALKRRLLLVRFWLVFKAGEISFCIIYLLTTLFLSQTTVIGGVLDLAQILLLFYFFWIVYAFMMELAEEQILKMSPSIVNSQGKIDDVSFPL